MSIEVEGVDVTIRKLSQYSIEREKEFDGIVRKTAKEIAVQSRINAPVRTGKLRDSIKPKYFTKEGPAATVFPRRAPHRHLIEYGTAQRFHKTGKSTGRVTPRPFMSRAAKASESQYLAEIRKVVDRVDTV